MPAINAIPAIVDADPGVLRAAELPIVTARHVDAQGSARKHEG